MMLSEWIKANKGMVARIGTDAGSGFIFAGEVNSFTLNHIEANTHVKMHTRQVQMVYRSIYGGVIVIVSGFEYGKEELSYTGALPGKTIPIQHYQNLIDQVASLAAEDYETALLKFHYARTDRDIQRATSEMEMARRFFLSDSFALMMPHVNGADILDLIEKKVDARLNE